MTLPPNRGAQFKKCDFQIHTMRDAAWKGPFDPINDRGAFSDALVSDCRRKGINAIAITDHHDLCLYKEVKLAATRELKPDGSPISGDERLVVFPGIELTLATPSCQALLIFDPSLSDSTLGLVLGTLRLAPTPDSSAKTTATHALHTDLTLSEISAALSGIRTNPEETNLAKFEFLEGKFILLPNVKKGGYKSIIRDGFKDHFKGMPCVGGYIEGCFYSELETGNRDKIEGKVLEWGKRQLGVFQTSDCRAATSTTAEGKTTVSFTDLGKWPTWVKWTAPSAEALRQACLARKSRISHTEPAYPLLHIAGVVVSDSAFLGKVELGLNPQFNAFIGGRGTGKSSLLEYIRWALCDDPLAAGEISELPNFQQRRKALIDGTLKPSNAKVSVFYRKNEVMYRIDRALLEKGDVITVFDGAGNGKTMSSSQVRSEFPIVSYAQKQLSCVGTLPEEINRLITSPVQEKVSEIQVAIEKDILPRLRQQREKEIRLSVLNTHIRESEDAIKSRKEQVQALQGQLKTLTPEQQALVQTHEILATQDQWIARTLEMPDAVASILWDARAQTEAIGTAEPPDSATQPKLAELARVVNEFAKKVSEQLTALITSVEEMSWISPAAQTVVDDTRSEYAAHLNEYEKCLAESARNQAQLLEIQSLNKIIGGLEAKLADARTERNSIQAVLDAAKNGVWDEFIAALEERAGLLRTQCEAINGQAQHEFRATLAFCRNGEPVTRVLNALAQGKNIKDSETKIRALSDTVCTDAHPVKKWKEVMTELDALLSNKGSEELPACPLLTEAGFTIANLTAVKNALSQAALEQIRFINIEDQIEFTFKMGKLPDGTPRYIPFNAASPGQQATCLLRTLLAQSGAPLLIDQPEEDLDNEQIQILSEKIAETKHNRQLLFVSHNANIVVNGDAELVASFGYSDKADTSRGGVIAVGSIDTREIRDRITAVMEGGREAFDLRKRKYGF